jgi:hypothetical protein
MKRRSSGNNGYIGYNQSAITNSGIVNIQKLYNTELNELPNYQFGVTGDSLISGNTSGLPRINYERPAGWITLPSVTAGSQQAVGAFAVFNNESNVCALQIQGAYNVDWGDGTTGSYGSSVVATKRYDQTTYAGLTSDVVRGYKTVLIKITPQAGQNLTYLDFVATPAGITGWRITSSSNWLDIKMSAPNLITLVVSRWYVTNISNRMLETFEFIGTAPLTSFNFISCFSLKKIIDFPSTRLVTGSWQSLFHTCFSLQEMPAKILDGISNATNLAYLFYYCFNLRSLPPLDTRNCTTFLGTFLGCNNLKQIPYLNTSKGTNFQSMFQNCNMLEEIPQIDTRLGTDFSNMFNACSNLRRIQPVLAGASGTNFSYMFANCPSLTTVPYINTSNGTNFQGMFQGLGCNTIPQYDYSKATDLSFFMRYAQAINYVPDFNTGASLTNCQYMFDTANGLQTCPGITMTNVTNVTNMLSNIGGLRTVPALNLSKVTTGTNMFQNTNYTIASVGLTGVSFSINLTNNIMGSTALNNLYNGLATVGASGSGARNLQVSGNWGFTASDRSIAIGKGWSVT